MEKGIKEDKMVGWHHQLNGRESEQTPSNSEGLGTLVCCCPWGCKVLGMTQQLDDNKYMDNIHILGEIRCCVFFFMHFHSQTMHLRH